MKKSNVSVDQFVKACFEYDSCEAVGDQLGMEKKAVASKMSNLRRKGIILPHYARQAVASIDVAAVNAAMKKAFGKRYEEAMKLASEKKPAAKKTKKVA
jgi:hypothetical protein